MTTKDVNKATGIWVYRNDAPKNTWNKTIKSLEAKLEGEFQPYQEESYDDKQLFLRDQRMSVDDLLEHFES